MAAAALALLAAAGDANAFNIEVFVDPSTWVIRGVQTDSEENTTVNFKDYAAQHQDQYGYWRYRYYSGGHFDSVIIENANTGAAITNLYANNLFYIDRSTKTAYTLVTGYNGSGNGTSGEVMTAAGLNQGDLWIGGKFLTAGGYSNTSYLSCYRWTEGWSGVNNIWASAQIISAFSWNGNYQLLITVSGGTPYVYGPTSSGGSYGYVYGNPLTVKGNDYYKTFSTFWFSQ